MCSALEQSNVKLSWDADETERVQLMRRDISKAEIKEMEYASYIASDESESDSEGEEVAA